MIELIGTKHDDCGGSIVESTRYLDQEGNPHLICIGCGQVIEGVEEVDLPRDNVA